MVNKQTILTCFVLSVGHDAIYGVVFLQKGPKIIIQKLTLKLINLSNDSEAMWML